MHRRSSRSCFRTGLRVITLRTSADGLHWVPDVASDYKKGGERVNGRLIRTGGPLVPMEFQIAPDELDPPDLEFYASTPFEHEGRYYLSMLNYAGCFVPLGTPPVSANGHGPGLDTELWVSRDGLNWDGRSAASIPPTRAWWSTTRWS